jgi:hypothetical protein
MRILKHGLRREAGHRPECSSALLAQLLELMDQDARQQPRAGHEDQAQLLKKPEGVKYAGSPYASSAGKPVASGALTWTSSTR